MSTGLGRDGRPAGRAGHRRAQGGLASDWLNDAVKGYLPGPDPDATRYYEGDSLAVDAASAWSPIPACGNRLRT
jgi:hypothetical protein